MSLGYTYLLCKGKYHYAAYLLLDWLVFNQTSKYSVHLM